MKGGKIEREVQKGHYRHPWGLEPSVSCAGQLGPISLWLCGSVTALLEDKAWWGPPRVLSTSQFSEFTQDITYKHSKAREILPGSVIPLSQFLKGDQTLLTSSRLMMGQRGPDTPFMGKGGLQASHTTTGQIPPGCPA